ncbi:MAG: hypothetical protein HQM14_04090 [SAR324 cluster bacterium]|nr:hypothetical protein [SAR324 cluster bacterium]
MGILDIPSGLADYLRKKEVQFIHIGEQWKHEKTSLPEAKVLKDVINSLQIDEDVLYSKSSFVAIDEGFYLIGSRNENDCYAYTSPWVGLFQCNRQLSLRLSRVEWETASIVAKHFNLDLQENVFDSNYFYKLNQLELGDWHEQYGGIPLESGSTEKDHSTRIVSYRRATKAIEIYFDGVLSVSKSDGRMKGIEFLQKYYLQNS